MALEDVTARTVITFLLPVTVLLPEHPKAVQGHATERDNGLCCDSTRKQSNQGTFDSWVVQCYTYTQT
jgi:hypothetical protein